MTCLIREHQLRRSRRCKICFDDHKRSESYRWHMPTRLVVITLTMLAGAAVAHAADEEPVCRSLLQQIGVAAQQMTTASDDEFEKSKYLKRIALMERSALQGPNPSSAAVFDSELSRAEQSLDAARTRSQVALSAGNMAMTAYVQQCPQHFAAIHGDYTQLVILAVKAMSDPHQGELTK
jgi:hypothetical protein